MSLFFHARLGFDNGGLATSNSSLRSGHTLSHFCCQLAVTPTRRPDLSDRSHGAKTETDFVMTNPDNKNISKNKLTFTFS